MLLLCLRMLSLKSVPIDPEASLFGRGDLDLENVFQRLHVLHDLPTLGFLEVELLL